jgi:hypothetical protein
MLWRFVARVVITVTWLVSSTVFAQTPAVLNGVLNKPGNPVAVPFACAPEDLQQAGLLCTEDEPCPIYLELSSITPNGKKIFLAGNLHATSATLFSVLLASEDNGATWKEPANRIRGAALDQLQFYDLEHGWAAGESQYPLARDPFFFLTTDGGQSWRQRPVTDDGGPGSVQRFAFDSPDHGELVVDAGKRSPGGRYLDYESETGGESWMIRGTGDQLPKLKHAPIVADNPDFRIRANKGGKSYQIEKRSGEKWEPLAAFLIEVANCRVKPEEAKEPAPETDAPATIPKDYVEELKLPGTAIPPKKKGPPN